MTRYVCCWNSGYFRNSGFRIEVVFGPICRVYDIREDEWTKSFREHMFSSSRLEYRFLKRRLYKNWWICNTSLLAQDWISVDSMEHNLHAMWKVIGKEDYLELKKTHRL